jgi:hypothetical protein
MAKDDKKPEQMLSVSESALKDLIAAGIAQIMSARTPDERIREAMDRQRGVGLPMAPEFLVPCVSPITGATFTARVIQSRSGETRCVDLLDYQRPVGWDVKEVDGGLVPGGESMPLKEENGTPGTRYTKWLYETFWMRDANEVGGKPIPSSWRADKAAPATGSVTLTAEELSKLGLTAEQIAAALAEKRAA